MRNASQSRFGPQRVGGKYLNGYWNQTYTVLSIRPEMNSQSEEITVRWEDGHTTSHATPWDSKRDRVL